MRTDAREGERQEDAAPVDMLAALFEARGWPYEFVAEDEITTEVQGSWANYQILAGSGGTRTTSSSCSASPTSACPTTSGWRCSRCLP